MKIYDIMFTLGKNENTYGGENMDVIVVVVVSVILSAILNNIAASKGWKKKAEIYADDRAYLRMLPIVLIVLYIVTVLVLPKMGIVLPSAILITIQIICVTFAVFLFELFR